MTALLFKDLRLTAHPALFFFLFFGVLLCVPGYPYGMVFFFGCLGLFFTTMNGRENGDVFFTATLPVRKGDVVRGRCALFVLVQLSQLLLSLPSAFLRPLWLPEGNVAGIEANAAYYGFGLLSFGLFNLIFLPAFYRTAYQAGRAFMKAMIPVALLIFIMEALSHFPDLAWLDSIRPNDQLRQLPFLAAGVMFYALATFWGCRIARHRFEQVDL